VLAHGGAMSQSTSGLTLAGTIGQSTGTALLSVEGLGAGIGFWYTVAMTGSQVGIGDSVDLFDPRLVLGQNQPNPVLGSTMIPFSVPERSRVTLRIFDVRGRVVADLVDDELDAGRYSTVFLPESLRSGIYFYRLTAGDRTIVRKLVVIR
jgi:hypothetical protein